MAGELVKIQDNVTSSATDQALSANSGRYLDLTKLSLVGGTAISSGSDLNTTAFLAVGNYYVGSNANAATISNLPSGFNEAFMLKTFAPTLSNGNTGAIGNNTWQYRLQEIADLNGTKIWRRICTTGSTNDTWGYSDWKLLTPQYSTYITTTAPTSSSADGIYLVI